MKTMTLLAVAMALLGGAAIAQDGAAPVVEGGAVAAPAGASGQDAERLLRALSAEQREEVQAQCGDILGAPEIFDATLVAVCGALS